MVHIKFIDTHYDGVTPTGMVHIKCIDTHYDGVTPTGMIHIKIFLASCLPLLIEDVMISKYFVTMFA